MIEKLNSYNHQFVAEQSMLLKIICQVWGSIQEGRSWGGGGGGLLDRVK